MEIKRVGPRRLLVTLTNEELHGMGLDYESLDYRDPRTRALLLSLLEVSRPEVEFLPGSRILIEAAPDAKGGCEIGFSDMKAPTQRWKVLRQEPMPVVYAFGDVDELIAAAVRLFRIAAHRIQRSALYRLGQGWRLLISAREGGIDPLDEYGPCCAQGPLAQAWLEEHAQPILHDQALDLLCAYFG